MAKKFRVLHVIVQPILVMEDENGEFEPGPQIEAQPMKLSQLALVPEQIYAQLAELQEQLEPAAAAAAHQEEDDTKVRYPSKDHEQAPFTMTVAELMSELSKIPADTNVTVVGGNDCNAALIYEHDGETRYLITTWG